MIYHDLKMKFGSPTINLYMDAQDYIKFVSNLKYYLSIDLEENVNCSECPCGKLDDITLNPKFKNGSGVDADVCVLKKFSGMDQVGVVTEYCAWYTVKHNYDFFDYISWLNGEMGEYRDEKQK